MEGNLAELLIGSSVQISRSDGELTSFPPSPNNAVSATLVKPGVDSPFVYMITRSSAFGEGEIRG